jgi:apolipoprotein N-acyltransferase
VLAFWLGLFVALVRVCRKAFGGFTVAILIPFLWTGLEYFRSELYYLRFSWLSVGYAFPDSPHVLAATGLGVYGIGWVIAACAAGLDLMKGVKRTVSFAVVLLIAGLTVNWPHATPPEPPGEHVNIAGIQLEFPDEGQLVPALDRIVREDSSVDMIVLSEYTLQRPPNHELKEWCKRNRRYLALGGKDFPPTEGPTTGSQRSASASAVIGGRKRVNSDPAFIAAGEKFANTVFVIDPNGEIIFRQVKCVPIQFFDDGIPAPEQKLWESPWGRIGFSICYDLSYRKVTDRLVQLGAQGLVVISADETDWGLEQHLQHSRIAPTRAAEHGIPIFRVACTGFSQWLAPDGRVLASASFPGHGEIIRGRLKLDRPGRLPFDHWLAPVCSGVTAVVIFLLVCQSFRIRGRKS